MLITILIVAAVGGLVASPYLLANALTKKTDELIIHINNTIGENPANRPLARLFGEVKDTNQRAKDALKQRRFVKALELATEASDSAVNIIKYLGV